MSKFKFIIWIIAIFAIHTKPYCNSIQTNKQIIDSIFNSFYSQIALKLINNKITEVNIVENNNYSYFINKLKSEFTYRNISVNSNSNASLQLHFNEFEINYTEAKDNLNRSFTINVSVYFTDKNGELSLLDNLSTNYKDEIDANDIDLIENKMFPFTKGRTPQAKKSFFDEIIEPVIVIGAAVLTVVLFFSVRTK